MKLKHIKTTLAAFWVLAMCTVVVIAQTTTLYSWAVLVALTLLPPIALMRFWNDPTPSMSESIREALR